MEVKEYVEKTKRETIMGMLVIMTAMIPLLLLSVYGDQLPIVDFPKAIIYWLKSSVDNMQVWHMVVLLGISTIVGRA